MRRTPLLLAAASSASLLLAGCGASTPAASGDAPEVAPAAATEEAPALADGLLPADRFAPGGTVTQVTGDEFAALLGGDHADHGSPADVTVTPQACVDALTAARTALGDPSAVEDAAGQYTRTGFTGTGEVLATGGPAATVVGTLTDAVAACPTATVATPMGQAVVTFGTVTTPDLGDAAAVVPVTVTVTRDQGPGMTGSALVGVVSDGDRVLGLATGGLGAAPDAAAFDALLADAAQHAADTLG
ncbi:hypothetical protein [Klenkia taihuensis]|uniref:PknH-like extracellular domain-containing protein n=1 Tax=Klenkia taihuensis TaxID=1225127 RepID=A0A1I1Q7F5_9ACTN|nr:hypothetical protein [Klenkia taihuensis]GHE08087.1 hypothetical protein GCM10011381_07310 [Klenkia taihuensis]SFD17937.1 hypothetical protein SAMN05661030_2640 [Klenkia taihuensis]